MKVMLLVFLGDLFYAPLEVCLDYLPLLFRFRQWLFFYLYQVVEFINESITYHRIDAIVLRVRHGFPEMARAATGAALSYYISMTVRSNQFLICSQLFLISLIKLSGRGT